jgi:hypothetical protein
VVSTSEIARLGQNIARPLDLTRSLGASSFVIITQSSNSGSVVELKSNLTGSCTGRAKASFFGLTFASCGDELADVQSLTGEFWDVEFSYSFASVFKCA